MEALKKNKKIFFNIGLLVIFVWLLITSYSQSKRKPIKKVQNPTNTVVPTFLPLAK